MYDGSKLWTLELKTVGGSSISFERDEHDKGEIHWYQIESLKKFGEYNNVCSGLLIDFRVTGNTWFLDIKRWDDLVKSISKKSFNELDLLCTSPVKVKKELLRTNYRYDVRKFLEDTKELS